MSNCAMPLLCYVIFCFAMFGSAPQDQSGQHNADQCSAMVCCLFSALMCRVMLPCANVNAIAMLCLLDQVPMHACMHTQTCMCRYVGMEAFMTSVCMFVRMCVCVYACAHILRHAYMYVRTYTCLYVWMYACMYVRMYVCMLECICMYANVCTYVSTCFLTVSMFVCVYGCMHAYIGMWLCLSVGMHLLVYVCSFVYVTIYAYLFLLLIEVVLFFSHRGTRDH